VAGFVPRLRQVLVRAGLGIVVGLVIYQLVLVARAPHNPGLAWCPAPGWAAAC
jgi:hypothetical protein